MHIVLYSLRLYFHHQSHCNWVLFLLWLHLFILQQEGGTAVVAVQRWSDFEEIPQVQGQRNPSKTVGGAKSSLESNTIPSRDTQRAQAYLVHIRTQTPHRD